MAIKFDTFASTGAGGGAVTSVNTQTGAVVLSANDLAADHTASNYTASNSNIDGHLSGIDTKLGTLTAGLTYKGAFNATAGTPSLTNALQGDLYIIDTAGTIYGQTWAVGDHLLINEDMGGTITNSKIDKVDNTDSVTSVNGSTGAVVLSGDDLAADHTAVNYTAANANIDGHLSGIDSKLANQLESGDNISVLTNDAGYITGITGENLGDLSDVTITAAASGEVLKYNGSAWVDASVAYSEVTGTPTNVSTFTNDSGYLTAITGESIGDLSDVTISSATNGQVLSYNGSAWVNSAASAGSLAGLSDVTITAAADGEYLRYNGSAWVDAALSILDDSSPQLGGALDTNGNAITSASNADVTIDPNGTGSISVGADIVPDADATHTIGSEANRFITAHTDINGAVRFKAKNDEGAAISKGAALYIKGISGTVPTVGLADADDASKMPAFGLAFAAANDQAEVQVITFGNLNDVNTSSFSAGDTLYVSTTAGALTATAPTGETAQLQNIGRVLRSDASAGIIKVGGAGRSAATPNLDTDKIFLGNASNQAVSTALSAIGLSKFNNDSGFITGVSGQSLGDLSDVTITAAASGEYLRYNGSAWVDAALSISDDSSPQLGGNIDVNSNYIVSASNGDIELEPNGTGSTVIRGNATGGSGHLVLNCEQNTHGVTIKGPPHSAAATYTLTLPNDDGTADQVLKTDGSGGLSWVDQPAGASPASETTAGVIEIATNAEAAAGTETNKALVPSNIASLDLSSMDNTTAGFISDLVSDSSPQLGGALDTNGNAITSASNGLVEITPNGTGAIKFGGNTNPAEARFFDEAGTNYVALKAPLDSAISADATFTLPAADGTNGQALTTNGSGVLSFTTISGGGGSAPTVTLASPSANYTISTHADNEEVYILTPSANIEVLLPAASSCGSGYKYQVKNMSASYSLTINPNSTETVDGQSTIIIGSQYESLTLITDGTNWFVI